MTGFGKAAGEVNGNAVSVEIKSLNSKFLELSLRLSAFRDKEAELRLWIGKELERGKAEISIQVEQAADSRKPVLNKELIREYYNDLLSLKTELGLESPDYLSILTGMPGIFNMERGETDEKTWKQLEDIIKKALRVFDEFRLTEGKALASDFSARLEAIASCLTKIEKLEPARLKAMRSRLKKGLSGMEELNIDKNRFEQEMLFYMEKMDITEEKVRLSSHIQFFTQTLKAKDSNGKKLGFILQEIGREINTIGSKANDAGMQRLVVEMKDELEKMKEQSANIL